MCVMGLATRKKGKEYRKEATYKYALLKAKSLSRHFLSCLFPSLWSIIEGTCLRYEIADKGAFI